MSAKPFVFDTDVLIIGGGFSGSWAALTARQHVENVLIVDKGPRDWGGLGGMSGGDMIVKQPEFAAKDLVEELVYYYDGLCEQDVLEEILNQSYERFKDYEKMGHEFARDDSGRLMSIPQRGLELMRYYFYHPYGKGGAHTTQILNAELQRLNVQRIGRIEITDLVKDGDAVSGAVGFHAQSGTPCLFRAKAVILAAHNGGWKGSYLLNTCAGEGAALAYGAGASLRNMEFIENWNVPKLFAWEGQTGMLPYGARFLNGEGEDFMRRYSPKLGAKADPHYNVRGMAFEVRAGRGPIYFDTSTMSPEGVEIMTPTGGWMKLNDTKLLQEQNRMDAAGAHLIRRHRGRQRRLERRSGPVRGRTRPQRHPRRLHGRLGHLQDHHDRLHRREQRGRVRFRAHLRTSVRRRPRFRHARRHPVPARQARRLSQGRGPAHAGAHGPDGRVHPQDRQGPHPLAGTP